jgi:hypothetical protein
MGNFTQGKASAQLRQLALEKIATLDLSDSKKRKIINVIDYSPYSRLYCEYLTADDPVAFRRELAPNKAFRKEAKKKGLDLKVIEEGTPDKGIEIDLDYESCASYESLAGYANHLFKLFKEALPKTRRSIEQDLDYDLDSSEVERAADLLARRMKEDRMDIDFPVFDDDDEFGPCLPLDAVQTQFHSIYSKPIKRGFEAEYHKARRGVEEWYEKYLRDGPLTLSDLVDRVRGEELNEAKEVLLKAGQGLATLLSKYADPEQVFETLEGVNNIVYHLKHYKAPTVSSKVKKQRTAKYFLKLEQLMPWDVTFGNDAGCCLGVFDLVHPKDGLENAYGLPVVQLHQGISVFGIYQQIGARDPARVGLALGFHSLSNQDKAAELINSVELSESMNPLNEDGLKVLINHVHSYLWSFCDRAGFKDLAEGNHDYNTGFNYADKSKFTPPNKHATLQLLPTNKTPPRFYSEVLERDGLTRDRTWSWVKR